MVRHLTNEEAGKLVHDNKGLLWNLATQFPTEFNIDDAQDAMGILKVMAFDYFKRFYLPNKGLSPKTFIYNYVKPRARLLYLKSKCDFTCGIYKAKWVKEKKMSRLDACISSDDERDSYSLIPDTAESIEEVTNRKITCEKIIKYMETRLPVQYREVARLRFVEGRTLRDCAEICGCAKENIRQKEVRIQRLMRRAFVPSKCEM